jgi:hypothetical protein
VVRRIEGIVAGGLRQREFSGAVEAAGERRRVGGGRRRSLPSLSPPFFPAAPLRAA